MPQIFISYSRVDNIFTDRFIERLQQAFPDVIIWRDKSPHGLIGGDNWWDEILSAIDDSDIFIYILSNESVKSVYCQAEFTEARRLQKRIVTIQARDKTELTDELDDIQFIDMKDEVDNPESLMRLNAAINKQLSLAKKHRPLWKPKTPKPQKESIPTRKPDAPEVTTPALTSPIAEHEALKIAKDGLRWQIILGVAAIAVTFIVGLLPYITEQIRVSNEKLVMQEETQAILDLTSLPNTQVTEILATQAQAATLSTEASPTVDILTSSPSIVTYTPTPTSVQNSNAVINAENVDHIQAQRRLIGHEAEILAVEFSPDSLTLATASRDSTIRIWSIDTGRQINVLTGHTDSIVDIAFNITGEILISGGNDTTVKLWDVSTGQLIQTLTNHNLQIYAVAYNPNPTREQFASGDTSGQIIIWDSSSLEPLYTLERHSVDDSIWGLAYTLNGEYLISGSYDNFARIRQVQTGLETSAIDTGGNVLDVAVNPAGTIIATANDSYSVELFEISTRQRLIELRGHTRVVYAVDFSPDGRLLASASNDGTIIIWDVETYEQLATLRAFSDDIRDVKFSPDGRLIASVGRIGTDNAVIIWSVQE